MPSKDVATSSGLPGFDSYLSIIAEKPAHFAVRLTDNRPALVFKRTTDYEEIRLIKERAIKGVQAVMENSMPAAWRPLVGSDPSVVGRAIHFADRHIGYLKWVDCDEPAEKSELFRQAGEQWQEERIIPERWSELHFLTMSKNDGHAFQALIDGFNNEIGVGWTPQDVSRFQREAETVRE